MARSNETSLTRSRYKEIKKYDHQQMEHFLQILFNEGYAAGFDAGGKAGRDSVPGIEVEDIGKIIRDTKGIGQVKAVAIMDRINEAFKKGGEANADQKSES